MNSQEALTRIVKGVAKFQAEVYPARRDLFKELRHHQEPIAMFFTCADSRIDPAMLLQTCPGEVFTERTPGNIVPKYSEHVGGVTASMEFAMLVLRVPLIIVCGHTDCGVVKALAEPERTNGMPALQSWMRHSFESRDRLLREHHDVSGEEKLQLLTEYNVLTQLENLKSHPTVATRLLNGELELRGWIYDIGDGSVREADPESGRFAMLGEEREG
ncbi:MAG: carbonic anhydrase [Candidatus Korobacteraceae bacterium]